MQFLKPLNQATWADLTEPQPPETFTSVEKFGFASQEENGAQRLSSLQEKWCRDGFVILKDFLPSEPLIAYENIRSQLPKDHSQRNNFYGGWAFPTPYMVCEELKDLALEKNLMNILELLIGEEMGLHLCLTGWVSTERNFHQDTYLNPSFLWSNYLAVWMALEDVSPDAGPFQYVPGSHRWETLRRDKLFSYLTEEQQSSPHWPTFTQDEIARICEEEIARRNAPIETFVPEKGDVLIWHSNLVHRGSEPKDKSLLRKSLICHYSAISKRLDMRMTKRHPKTNGIYFDLPVEGSVRP